MKPSNARPRVFPVAALLAIAACGAGLGGCDFLDPTIDSPFTGKPVNEAGLARELAQQEAAAKAEAKAKADQAAAEIRAAHAQARRTAIELQQKQTVTAAEIQATAARVEAETGQRVEDAQAVAASALHALEARMGVLSQQAADAQSAITAKREAIGGVLGVIANNPLVRSADAASGGAVLGLLGLAGGWIGRASGSRKRHDESYEEGYARAKAEAEAARHQADAASSQAQLRLLSLLTPPPASVPPAPSVLAEAPRS